GPARRTGGVARAPARPASPAVIGPAAGRGGAVGDPVTATAVAMTADGAVTTPARRRRLQRREGGERDPQPAGPVARLVDRLVHGLVRDVGREQHLLVGGEVAVAGVAGEEGGGAALRPRDRSVAPVLTLLRVEAGGREHDRVRGVVEGAEHAGDVAPRGVGLAPVGERLGRLALEVDDLPVDDRAQRLTEVQVAV